ncbi:MAG: hypothetical protein JST67_07455 [Bacteroidetes bacterium]|nr:hypothetical protein [Bacteroidota bacterium]
MLSIVAGSAVLLASCDGLGKMIKKQNLISYTVTPNPVEEKADSVAFNISGKYPAKLFAKKAVVTVTPVMKYTSGGEKALESVTLLGEKATGNGQKIPYAQGGTFSKTFSAPYEAGMKNCTVELRAVGNKSGSTKTKSFKDVKMADGTIITPLLVRHDEKGIFAKDAFTKTTPANQTTHIFYAINQANVRGGEMSSAEMKAVDKFVKENINNAWYEFKGVSVSAYASPDGETDKNMHLAEDRAKSATSAMEGMFKKDKKAKFGKQKTDYTTGTTKEDWEGFQAAMQQSTMKDKDLVLRVLTMYNDPNQRRKEIKNLSATYTELAKDILPKLRRAEVVVNVDKKSRTDEAISRLATSRPDSLSVEELLYAGTLTSDVNTKITIYQNAEKQYGSDWRTSNNLGVAYLMNNKVDDAKAAFDRASKNASGNPIVANNTGIIYAKNGDRKTAMDYYNKASGAGAEVNYNKGIVNIRDGKYSDAVSNFGSFKGFNLALAQLLNGNPESVNGTIDASTEKEAAMSDYLKAVASARKGDSGNGMTLLKSAIGKDASLKAMAKDDCEFLKWRENADFKSLTN